MKTIKVHAFYFKVDLITTIGSQTLLILCQSFRNLLIELCSTHVYLWFQKMIRIPDFIADKFIPVSL